MRLWFWITLTIWPFVSSRFMDCKQYPKQVRCRLFGFLFGCRKVVKFFTSLHKQHGFLKAACGGSFLSVALCWRNTTLVWHWLRKLKFWGRIVLDVQHFKKRPYLLLPLLNCRSNKLGIEERNRPKFHRIRSWFKSGSGWESGDLQSYC